MDIEILNNWASQPDVCRCCLSAGGSWDLATSYISESGMKEVYYDMLQECYGIKLSCSLDWGPSRLICGLCVSQLRDAYNFRNQVINAEKCYLEYHRKELDMEEKMKKGQVQVIIETNHISDNVGDIGYEYEDGFIKIEKPINYHISNNDPENKNDVNENINQTDEKTYENNTTPLVTRKRNRITCKTKRMRKSSEIKEEVDSDTPIAHLSTKQIRESVKENEPEENTTSITSETTCREEHTSRKHPYKKIAQSYTDNRNLRSKIILILKYSTIIPFKHLYNNRYICFYCKNGYISFTNLKEHLEESHTVISDQDILLQLKTPKDLVKADVSNVKCRLCMEHFKCIENFVEHLIEVHRKVYYHTTRFKPSHGILGFNLQSDELKCHICNATFRFFKNLSIHMNEHSESFICYTCGKKFVSDHRLQTHIKIHKRSDIKCKHCGVEFRTVSARSYHIRKFHTRAKFNCSECSQEFLQYQHRLRHLVEAHRLKIPDFQCEICLKKFASTGGLRAHIRYSHLKNKEYVCEICGRVFVYKWIWQRHLDAHSGIKNYECKFCNKKFAKSYTLEVHIRIHLNDKRFACVVCNTAFVQKCSLQNHIKVHHSTKGLTPDKSCVSG